MSGQALRSDSSRPATEKAASVLVGSLPMEVPSPAGTLPSGRSLTRPASSRVGPSKRSAAAYRPCDWPLPVTSSPMTDSSSAALVPSIHAVAMPSSPRSDMSCEKPSASESGADAASLTALSTTPWSSPQRTHSGWTEQ